MNKTQLKWWHPVAGIVAIFMLYDLLSGEETSNTQASSEKKPDLEIRKNPSSQTNVTTVDPQVIISQANINAQRTASLSLGNQQSQRSVLTPREVSVPTYKTLIEAARLIQQANNIDVMKDYISLEQSRRNLLLRKQNAELETSLKEIEAKYYEANAKIEHLQENGIMSPTQMSGMGMPMNVTNSVQNETGVRLMAIRELKNKKYALTIKINGVVYSSVQVGQTAGDYKVTSMNSKLNCVTLNTINNADEKVVCLN